MTCVVSLLDARHAHAVSTCGTEQETCVNLISGRKLTSDMHDWSQYTSEYTSEYVAISSVFNNYLHMLQEVGPHKPELQVHM